MNAIRLGALITILTIVATNSTALAQNSITSRSTVPRDNPLVVAPMVTYPDYYGSRFSSTNAEGLGRGLGAFAGGIGEMNLYNSMAAANFQEARRRAIENRRLAVENYFAMRRMNEEYREAQLHRRGSMIHTSESDDAVRVSADQPKQRSTRPSRDRVAGTQRIASSSNYRSRQLRRGNDM